MTSFNSTELEKPLPFFTDRLPDLERMAKGIFSNAKALRDHGQLNTFYSALSWGTGKTALGLQCLKQFYVQEQMLANRHTSKSLEQVHYGQKMYLAHVNLGVLAKLENVTQYGGTSASVCLSYVEVTKTLL